jgi:hypothetical protein
MVMAKKSKSRKSAKRSGKKSATKRSPRKAAKKSGRKAALKSPAKRSPAKASRASARKSSNKKASPARKVAGPARRLAAKPGVRTPSSKKAPVAQRVSPVREPGATPALEAVEQLTLDVGETAAKDAAVIPVATIEEGAEDKQEQEEIRGRGKVRPDRGS